VEKPAQETADGAEREGSLAPRGLQPKAPRSKPAKKQKNAPSSLAACRRLPFTIHIGHLGLWILGRSEEFAAFPADSLLRVRLDSEKKAVLTQRRTNYPKKLSTTAKSQIATSRVGSRFSLERPSFTSKPQLLPAASNGCGGKKKIMC
jgi:hypothetical protein